MRSAAQAESKLQNADVKKFVGRKIRELRGDMPPGDFAPKNGLHQAEVGLYEHGEKTASLYKLRHLAEKHHISVKDFFPGGKVPDNYPEY